MVYIAKIQASQGYIRRLSQGKINSKKKWAPQADASYIMENQRLAQCWHTTGSSNKPAAPGMWLVYPYIVISLYTLPMEYLSRSLMCGKAEILTYKVKPEMGRKKKKQ